MNYPYNVAMSLVVVGLVVLLAVVLLAAFYFWLWRTRIKNYADPQKAADKISYVQLLLLGVGGIGGVGTLVAAYLTITNAANVEESRSETEFVQKYLESMESLITTYELPQFKANTKAKDKNRIRRIARVQTLAVLRAIEDTDRKRLVMRFLDESDLILKPKPVVDLSDANFNDANLYYVGLGGSALDHALLKRANFFDSSLVETSFYGAYLEEANFEGANLTGADLRETGLTGAKLRDANLTNADLRGAVGVTNEKLEQQAKSLKGATMPDGSKHD